MKFTLPKLKLKPRAKPVALSLYFGIPGAGKSTYAAYLAKKDMKKGRKVWSNFGITGALKCEKSDFGKYMMCDGRLIIDEAGLYVSRSDYWETVLSSKGSTVQIGSPQSKVLVRIYDKAAERHCEPGTHWVRVEMQLRDDRALQFTKIPMTVGEAFSGVLLNYLRYVIPDDTDTNKWRWQMTDYWLDTLEVLTPIKIYTAPGMDYNIDRCREYVVNQAGNAIDALLQIYGIHEFQRLIRERPTVENPKYTRLVQQYKADRLSAMAGRYMT